MSKQISYTQDSIIVENSAGLCIVRNADDLASTQSVLMLHVNLYAYWGITRICEKAGLDSLN